MLKDLKGVKNVEETSTPFIFVDTVGCGLDEEQEEDNESRSNKGEAKIVEIFVKKLLKVKIF